MRRGLKRVATLWGVNIKLSCSWFPDEEGTETTSERLDSAASASESCSWFPDEEGTETDNGAWVPANAKV